MEKYDIVDLTAQTIIECNTDTFIDYAELGIDKLLDIEDFQNTPIVKPIYGILKTCYAIREKHMLKKTLEFIVSLNNNTINNENYNEYKEKLKNKDKTLYKELEHILIIIDRFIDVNKTKILAKLYLNYIDKQISWNEFQELSIILDNLFLNDIDELEHFYNNNELSMNDIKNEFSVRRLKTLNLIEDIQSSSRDMFDNINICYTENDYRITCLGNILFKYGIKKDS